jgi:uncharacterized protein
MGLKFEWDPNKAAENEAKHSVPFPEAATVLADPLSISIEDPDHSFGEVRWVTIGLSFRGGLLVVWHADRGDALRIIGARTATPRERRDYEQG